MNILLLTEHYKPKVGGTVSYVENISKELSKKGNHVFLLIPVSGINELAYKEKSDFLTILELSVCKDEAGIFAPSGRSELINWITKDLILLCNELKIEIVHLLYGLFLAGVLPTDELRSNGVKTFHTIHNIPPLECSTSWKNDRIDYYLKDELRKYFVRLVNKRRILKNKFDGYIVPSNVVKNELHKYLGGAKIKSIAHGGAEYIDTRVLKKGQNNKLSILTVGGIVPHKNQNQIPDISNYLRENGVDFEWNIIGPVRNKRYYAQLKKEIERLKLEEIVFVHNNIDSKQLRQYYETSDMYIHLSTEEGFCMTVLDAISYGIPTLGRPTGAIVEMLSEVDGVILDLKQGYLSEIINHYVKIVESIKIEEEKLMLFKEKYTWSNAASQLMEVYSAE
ncbi:MAG: glycosyltransferase family 4 protein [Flavobacteriales bacterium]|nr:glycosyltransferase family 4 protein [Flavobacteriales bacterium]